MDGSNGAGGLSKSPVSHHSHADLASDGSYTGRKREMQSEEHPMKRVRCFAPSRPHSTEEDEGPEDKPELLGELLVLTCPPFFINTPEDDDDASAVPPPANTIVPRSLLTPLVA